jgi:HAD superfamily hydrolase (TIGR01549 family)
MKLALNCEVMCVIMSLNNTPKLVLFDLDDTLFDHQYSRRCGLIALQQTNPILSQVSLKSLTNAHERQLIDSYSHVLNGNMSLQANRLQRFQRMFKSLGLEISKAETKRALYIFRQAYEANRRAVRGVPSLMTYLKSRARIGVITNGLRTAQEGKLFCCQLTNFVDFLLTSEETGVKKPDPHFFNIALERGHTHSVDAIVIGDSWELDVLGSHCAGIRSIWLNRNEEPCPDSRLTTELTSFEPLENILKALATL